MNPQNILLNFFSLSIDINDKGLYALSTIGKGSLGVKFRFCLAALPKYSVVTINMAIFI